MPANRKSNAAEPKRLTDAHLFLGFFPVEAVMMSRSIPSFFLTVAGMAQH